MIEKSWNKMEINSKTTNINIRIDADLKKQAENLFNELGLNMSVAVNLFLIQCVKRQEIPFEITKSKNQVFSYTPSKEDTSVYQNLL